MSGCWCFFGYILSVFLVLLSREGWCYNLDDRNVKVVSSEQLGDYFGVSLVLKNDGRCDLYLILLI